MLYVAQKHENILRQLDSGTKSLSQAEYFELLILQNKLSFSTSLLLETMPEFYMWTFKCNITVPHKVSSDVSDQINWILSYHFSFKWTSGSTYLMNGRIYTRLCTPSKDISTECEHICLLYLTVKMWCYCGMYCPDGLFFYGRNPDGNPEAEVKAVTCCDRYCLSERHVRRCAGKGTPIWDIWTHTKRASESIYISNRTVQVWQPLVAASQRNVVLLAIYFTVYAHTTTHLVTRIFDVQTLKTTMPLFYAMELVSDPLSSLLRKE